MRIKQRDYTQLVENNEEITIFTSLRYKQEYKIYSPPLYPTIQIARVLIEIRNRCIVAMHVYAPPML